MTNYKRNMYNCMMYVCNNKKGRGKEVATYNFKLFLICASSSSGYMG